MRNVIFLSVALFFISVYCTQDLKISEVTRRIDLTSQLAKHKVSLAITNKGQAPINHAQLSFTQEQAKLISVLSVFDESGASLTVQPDDSASKEGVIFYNVQLGSPLAPSASLTLKIRYILTHSIFAFPSHITQSERQLVKYNDNVYFFSPYEVGKQTTTVKLASSSVQSNSDHNPTVVKGDTIVYGPYHNAAPYKSAVLSVHYENNKPFLTISQFERFVEVSHWGNVAVEDWLKVKHDGAKLKGSFSRYEYQINPQANGQSAIKSIIEFLPSPAEDVYYRDDIGNVTTSFLSTRQRGGKPAQHLELLPRFPLFGGWQTEYYMGYNLPLKYSLFTRSDDSSAYVLNVTFGSDFQNEVVIDKQIVHVILPEGASNVEFKSPFSYDEKSEYKHFTYLDTTGRPVIKVVKYNTINEHSTQYFQVTYRFGKLGMLREPLLLIGAYIVFFVMVMFYLRFDLPILPGKIVEKPSVIKSNDLLTRYSNVVQERKKLYNGFDDAIANFLKTKSDKSYNDEKKRIETGLAKALKEAKKIVGELDKVDGNLFGKISSIEKKYKAKESAVNELHTLIKNKKDSKDLTKQKFDDFKNKLAKDIERLDSEIDALVSEITEDLD